MLISRSKQFIYLKTRKTAGTSVEVYFEKYCVDPAERHEETHYRSEMESEWGVIGHRGPKSGARRWYNHMPAQTVLSLIGQEAWDSCHKFCVVRNPFDKVVSNFWFQLSESQRIRLSAVDFRVVRALFGSWVALGALPQDQEVYKIDGQVVVNQIVRYENLLPDVESVCSRLAIPWDPGRLPRFKSEYRVRGESFPEYYDSRSAALVAGAFAWELEHFGYASRWDGSESPSKP